MLPSSKRRLSLDDMTAETTDTRRGDTPSQTGIVRSPMKKQRMPVKPKRRTSPLLFPFFSGRGILRSPGKNRSPIKYCSLQTQRPPSHITSQPSLSSMLRHRLTAINKNDSTVRDLYFLSDENEEERVERASNMREISASFGDSSAVVQWVAETVEENIQLRNKNAELSSLYVQAQSERDKSTYLLHETRNKCAEKTFTLEKFKTAFGLKSSNMVPCQQTTDFLENSTPSDSTPQMSGSTSRKRQTLTHKKIIAFGRRCAEGAMNATKEHMGKRAIDYSHALGLSQHKITDIDRVLTTETAQETRKRKAQETDSNRRKIPAMIRTTEERRIKDNNGNDIVSCVQRVCEKLNVQSPTSIDEIEKLETEGRSRCSGKKNACSGFWTAVADEWEKNNTSAKRIYTTDLKALYCEKLNITRSAPIARARHVRVSIPVEAPWGETIILDDITINGLPSAEYCSKLMEGKIKGDNMPRPRRAFNVLQLQMLQKIPQKLIDSRSHLEAILEKISIEGQLPLGFDFTSVLSIELEGWTQTLGEKHSTWKHELLAHLFKRVHEERYDSEIEAAFGEAPTDDEAREWAKNEDVYLGEVVEFLHEDGTVVEARVMHIRVVLLMYLQEAANNGYLKKPTDPFHRRFLKNIMEWKDATNTAKRSLCLGCLKLAPDPENFSSGSGTDPLIWTVCPDMPETKENYEILNTLFVLLRGELDTMHVVDENGETSATFDCSNYGSAIGDAHACEVHDFTYEYFGRC